MKAEDTRITATIVGVASARFAVTDFMANYGAPSIGDARTVLITSAFRQ